jgi:hypothetical protein
VFVAGGLTSALTIIYFNNFCPVKINKFTQAMIALTSSLSVGLMYNVFLIVTKQTQGFYFFDWRYLINISIWFICPPLDSLRGGVIGVCVALIHKSLSTWRNYKTDEKAQSN